MSNFDWQTEEEAEAIWEDLPQQTPKRPFVWPTWLTRWLLIILCLGLIAGGVTYWQLNRRVQLATQRVETDLLASHSLLQQVVAAKDADLFRSLISGRDLNWVYTQLNRLERGLLVQRPAFRLVQTGAAATPDVVLAPDLAAAELTTLDAFLTPAGEMVQLQQTAVYRLGAGQRWLLAPPEPDFWGELAVLTGERVTLRFPERDRAVAEQLHADLETAVNTVCTNLPNIVCGVALRVRVTLDTSPRYLLRGSSREAMLRSGLDVVLPTPTLVGLPIDEAGYELLRQGYTGQVLTAVIAYLTSYECCDQQHFFMALIDKQLSQLGLQPWPLTAADHDQLLLEEISLERLSRIWRSSRHVVSDWRLVYATLDFLLADVAQTPSLGQWQQEIAQQNEAGQLAQWINDASYEWVLADNLLHHIYQRSQSAQLAQAPSPLPPPALFECDTLTHTVVNQFDFANATWQTIYQIASPDNGYFATENSITPLPDGQTFLVEQQQNRVDTLHGNLLIGRADETFLLLTLSVDILTSHPGFYFTGEAPPNDDVLLLASRDNPRLITRHYLLDVAACTSGDCPLAVREAWATWSPNGQQTLLAGRPPRLAEGGDPILREWQRPLFMGDGSAQPLAAIGTGGRPFWVDDNQYATIQINEATRELQFALLDTESQQPVFALTPADLRPLLPDTATDLYIVAAHPLPNRAAAFLLEVRDDLAQPTMTHLFSLDVAAREAARLVQTVRGEVAYEMAENGRYLALTQESNPGFVRLLDLAQGQHSLLAAKQVRWSPNGRWLLREFGHHALLYAPDDAYHYLLPLPQPNCRSIGWSQS